METFGSRLKNARKSKGLTQKELADLINAKHNSISNWENNQNKPDPDTIELICGVLNISPNYLLKVDEPNIDADELSLLSLYRKLDSLGQNEVKRFAKRELERVQLTQQLEYTIRQCPSVVRMYTYLNRIASAGKGFYFDDIPTDQIEAPYLEGADFIVGVNGDSMEPEYYDGDKVYVKKCLDLDIGDVGIFTLDGECYIKEWGGDSLISYNDDYDDIPIYEDSDIRCVGRVIGKLGEEE